MTSVSRNKVDMESLFVLTSEIKEALFDTADDVTKEKLIFSHIQAAEKLNILVEDFPSGKILT